MRSRTTIVWCAAIAALFQVLAVDLAARGSVLVILDSRARAAFVPLASFFEQRYASVPRLVDGTVSFLGHEDDATRALTAAHARFAEATGIGAKVTAALGIELALRDLLLEQMRKYPEMTSEYDFIVARRGFQITTGLMQPAIRTYNAAAHRFLSYASRFPNDLVARALGMHHALYRLPRPRPTPAGEEGPS